MKRRAIITINLLIMGSILFFIFRYANDKARESTHNSIQAFEKMTTTTSQIIINYLEDEQHLCDIWANYVNSAATDGAPMTANEAISNVLLEEAFKTGNIDKLILKGIERASEIEEEIKMIRIMRMDFELLEGLMQNLSELDSRIMIKRFVEKKYYKEIACEEHTNYDSVKRRIKALCRMLKEEIIEYLEMNCRDIKL